MRGPRTPLKRANNQLVSPPLRETRAVDIGSLWAEKFVVWILIRPTLSPDDKSRKTNFVPSNSMCIYVYIYIYVQFPNQSFPRPKDFERWKVSRKIDFQAAIFLSFHICWNERTNWFLSTLVEVAPKSLSKKKKSWKSFAWPTNRLHQPTVWPNNDRRIVKKKEKKERSDSSSKNRALAWSLMIMDRYSPQKN